MAVIRRKQVKQEKDDSARLKSSFRPLHSSLRCPLRLSIAIASMLLTTVWLFNLMQQHVEFDTFDFNSELLTMAIGQSEQPLPSDAQVPSEKSESVNSFSPSAPVDDVAAKTVLAKNTTPNDRQKSQIHMLAREETKKHRKNQENNFRAKLKEELAYRRTLPLVPYWPTKNDLHHSSTVTFSAFCRTHNQPGFEFGPLADKHSIKSFVASVAPDLYVAKEYANFVAANVTELNDDFLSNLPARTFLLKAAHACGAISVVQLEDDTVRCIKKPCLQRKKTKKRIEPVGKFLQRLCHSYLQYNYTKFLNEAQYSNIPTRCILEEFLDIDSLYDYKFHIFHGRPMLLSIYGSRFNMTQATTIDELTVDWKVIPVKAGNKGTARRLNVGPKPQFLNHMVETAKKLAVHAAEVAYFPYIRVDFFVYRSKTDNQTMPMQIAFSELTLSPRACMQIFVAHPHANHFYGYVGQHPELNISSNAVLDFV